ncbi:uncharacterized protein LOC134542177 isoform X2 [Bacillus rossius redtenbacheri]|uniref:uncharacterized protein LOC134542177 isoform X2 n=1 Tax=Bacillus rossius redtenbacheri TaxID=93214 RepID=UPI002FDD8F7A
MARGAEGGAGLALAQARGGHVTALGEWRAGVDLRALLRQGASPRDLRGAALQVVAARLNDDYNFSSFEETVGIPAHDSSARYFRCLQVLCNFQTILKITDQSARLSMTDNEGITEMLQKEEFDVVATLSGVLPITFQHADFLQPISQFQPVIVFLQPTVSTLRNVFLLPFAGATWAALLATVVASTAALMAGVALAEGSGRPWTMCDVTLLVAGVICQQSVAELPRSMSARTTISLLMLSTILTWSVYTGSVMSFFSTPDQPIRTLSHLVQFKYEMAIDEYTHLNMNSTGRGADLQGLAADARVLDSNDGIAWLRAGRHCFYSAQMLVEEPSKGLLSTAELCRLTFLSLRDGNIRLAMTVPKNSQFKEALNWGIMRIREAGINEYLYRFKIIDLPKCSTDVTDLEMVELGPAFVLLGMACIVSVTVLLVELASVKCTWMNPSTNWK